MIRIVLVALAALWLTWILAFAVEIDVSDLHPGDTTLWLGYEDASSGS